MRAHFTLLCTLLAGLLFEMAEMLEPRYFPAKQAFFLLSEHKMWFSSVVYYVAEHFVDITFMVILFFEAPHLRFIVAFYAGLEFLDCVDFLISGNSAWFIFNGWPVTFNVIKILVFILAIEYEFLRYHTTGSISN